MEANYLYLHDFLSRCFSLCLQLLKNSDRRFSEASAGLNIIRYFSVVQSLQNPEVGLNANLVSSRMFHCNKYGIP